MPGTQHRQRCPWLHGLAASVPAGLASLGCWTAGPHPRASQISGNSGSPTLCNPNSSNLAGPKECSAMGGGDSCINDSSIRDCPVLWGLRTGRAAHGGGRGGDAEPVLRVLPPEIHRLCGQLQLPNDCPLLVPDLRLVAGDLPTCQSGVMGGGGVGRAGQNIRGCDQYMG